MQFRSDINSLRAIAVITVVVFHFNNDLLPGGFIGVDIFFVISGFLMTGIIFTGIEKNNFSICKFYVARANRIIPALAILCLFLLVFGWFYLNPIDYKELGTHVSSSMSFISNTTYRKEAGYFDAASHEKWLLHTWSLSVEWQFYILYPLFLIGIRKFFNYEKTKLIILFFTIINFIYCIIVTYSSPNKAFYFLSYRSWEMLLGGLAFLYPFSLLEKHRSILFWTGLTIIISCLFFLSEKSLWPGYLALLPTIGAFLFIQANINNSLISSNIVFQKIGKWSYSIYLWHWPISVFLVYMSMESWWYIGILASIFLGWFSFRFIERTKYPLITEWKNLHKIRPLWMLLVTYIIGVLVTYNSGFIERLDGERKIKVESAFLAIKDWNYPKPNLTINNKKIRFIDNNSDKNILFIGASHIEQTYPYVSNLNSNYNVYYLTKGGCFLARSFINPEWECSNIQDYEAIIESISFEKIVTSVYAFDMYLSEENKIAELNNRTYEFNKFLKYAKKHSQEIYIILGEPRGEEFNPKTSLRKNLRDYISLEAATKSYENHSHLINSLDDLKSITIINPLDHLCDKEKCRVMDQNFNYFYKDNTHMRAWYAKKALPYLNPIFED